MATRPTDRVSERSEPYEDPRMRPPGSAGMPAETIDTPHNMPGNQQTPPATDAEHPASTNDAVEPDDPHEPTATR